MVTAMSQELANLVDLQTAWRRVKFDIPDRVFIRHPYEIKLIELNLEDWLARLLEKVRNGTYSPDAIMVADVPKGRSAVRPAGHLAMADRTMYAACVGACFTNIHQTLRWSQGTVDFSYRLASDPADPGWISNSFTSWTDFRTKSLDKIASGIAYVIIADIAGYYENIDLSTLVSDLRQIGASVEAVDQLSVCLNRWAQVQGRGIPQGHSPSDILGKLYLNSIDLNLRNKGYSHFRYVADIRIFCRNLVEAKRAMVDLIVLLRQRGLSLQSSKSEIHRADEAKEIIDGVAPVINSVRERYIEEIISALGLDNPYISLSYAESLLADYPEDAPLELIHEAYQTYFLDSSDDDFDTTLFRFLLKRLGKAKDNFAITDCITLIEKHPEETRNILSYFSSAEVVADVTEPIVHFLDSDNAVYQYQVYEIMEWFSTASDPLGESVVRVARRFAFDRSQPLYLRCVCRKILGDFGSAADLELLQASYSDASSELERSEILCSLERMERGRRNAFLGRVRNGSDMVSRAVMFVRGNER